MTELNMKNKKQPLIAKIVDVSFVCIVILLMMASLSTLVIGSFFQENEKNGILAYELQQPEALEKNGWRTFGKYYAKNNLVARISQQDQGVTIDIYYK